MNDHRRRVASSILGIAGAVLLLVGGFALYARQELFNSDNQFVRQFLSGASRGPLGME